MISREPRGEGGARGKAAQTTTVTGVETTAGGGELGLSSQREARWDSRQRAEQSEGSRVENRAEATSGVGTLPKAASLPRAREKVSHWRYNDFSQQVAKIKPQSRKLPG